MLQRWLARRYRRAAFPTQFNIRLKKGKADRKIAEKLKPHGNAIRAIYFDVDEGLGLEKTNPSDLYKLGITIVYDGRDGAKSASSLFQVGTAIFSFPAMR